MLLFGRNALLPGRPTAAVGSREGRATTTGRHYMLRRIGRYLRQHHLALLALFIVLGGGSAYAAATLVPRNSVGSKQVINGSLQTLDLSKKARTALKGNRGLRGPQGAQGARGVTGPQGIQGARGPTGSRGPAGSAVAYAYVNAAGVLDPARSSNIVAANVTKSLTGFYCFNGLGFTPHNIQVTPDSLSSGGTMGVMDAHGSLSDLPGCPGVEQANVVMWDNEASPAFHDWAFYVEFN
jgi:Collagen triple helix repeat (20 copies)